jgi:hypothetical protein
VVYHSVTVHHHPISNTLDSGNRVLYVLVPSCWLFDEAPLKHRLAEPRFDAFHRVNAILGSYHQWLSFNWIWINQPSSSELHGRAAAVGSYNKVQDKASWDGRGVSRADRRQEQGTMSTPMG